MSLPCSASGRKLRNLVNHSNFLNDQMFDVRFLRSSGSLWRTQWGARKTTGRKGGKNPTRYRLVLVIKVTNPFKEFYWVESLGYTKSNQT